MPKTKKKFIDKKKAVTFHVVHRSQQDPLISDERAPQHVLLPAYSDSRVKIDSRKRLEEQKRYGIFFDDDYNYLQHLRSAEDAVCDWVPATTIAKNTDKLSSTSEHDEKGKEAFKIQLPSSVFASSVEEKVGMLNKAAPRSGLCLELDPDVVAAMDEDFEFSDPENELEDNFVELANAEGDKSDEDCIDSGSDYDSEENDEINSLRDNVCEFEEEETKSRFTNYSMSSSVIRRNSNLTLLDEQFEQLYADYDDNEIGALDNEEIEGHVEADLDLVLKYANEFESEKTLGTNEKEKTIQLVENMNFDEETELIQVPDKTNNWDCKSILSTYSNLYNRPKLISEPKGPQRIVISSRTGVPVNILGNENKLTARTLAKFDSAMRESGNDRAESIISTLSSLSIRPKNETLEEKRERKKAIREYRKVRREERKLNTEAFKDEKKRQEKILLNNRNNLQGVRIV